MYINTKITIAVLIFRQKINILISELTFKITVIAPNHSPYLLSISFPLLPIVLSIAVMLYFTLLSSISVFVNRFKSFLPAPLSGFNLILIGVPPQ